MLLCLQEKSQFKSENNDKQQGQHLVIPSPWSKDDGCLLIAI